MVRTKQIAAEKMGPETAQTSSAKGEMKLLKRHKHIHILLV